jgi:excisionase family DNA binding protein
VGSQSSATLFLEPKIMSNSFSPKPSQTDPAKAKLLYGVRETAEQLSLSRSTIYNFFRTGELPFLKIGERRLVEASAIADFIQRMKQNMATA